ncbi:hypothetical protein [Novipirellula aureliae]|nr:hypothetical protein [Novipirellula aureliae]
MGADNGEPWQGLEGAKLAMDVRSQNTQTLHVGLNRDEHVAEVKPAGGGQWQTVVRSVAEFRDRSGKTLADWNGLMELKRAPKHQADPRPEFSNLRWPVDEKEIVVDDLEGLIKQ